jgi:PAS domain S-box-containing protein
MAVEKTTSASKKDATGITPPGRPLRDEAEERLARSRKISPTLTEQPPEELIHELQVHQIELEMQAEELQRSQLALEESRDKYVDLYDFAPVGYLTLTDKALVKEVNLTGALLLGVVRRKLIKARFRRFIAPKDLDLWDRHFVNMTRTGEPQSFDLELMQSDGSTFPARLDCIRMEKDGEEPAIRIAISDITRQKEAEAAIRESEERFWLLFSETPLPYQSLDADGKLLEVNPTWLATLGYTRDEVIGKRFGDFLAPDNREMFRTIFGKFKESGAVNNVELEIQTKDGNELAVSWTGRIGHNTDGSFRQTYCILADITERKRAEKALQQVNKQMNLLSSITRHDILNQLLALKGYLDLSHEVIDNPTTLLEYIKKVEKAANTIEHQIRFTKDYQDLGVAAPEWQNVNASITKAVAGLPMREVRVEIDPQNPEVFADRLFEKVFYNLIDNALRYGGDQMKTIRITSQESDRGLTIVCEDDGVGISEEDKKKLFTRGFGKNTGLGLFLSREILAITGITITENGTPGKGARFEITVPKGEYRFAGTGQK